jgi:hypothetical protein
MFMNIDNANHRNPNIIDILVDGTIVVDGMPIGKTFNAHKKRSGYMSPAAAVKLGKLAAKMVDPEPGTPEWLMKQRQLNDAYFCPMYDGSPDKQLIKAQLAAMGIR